MTLTFKHDHLLHKDKRTRTNTLKSSFRGVLLPMNLRPNERLKICNAIQQTRYPRKNVYTNQQKFENPRALTPTKKNDSTVCVSGLRSRELFIKHSTISKVDIFHYKTWEIIGSKCTHFSNYRLSFVWSFSSHSIFFHSFGDITIAGEGLQILTYARHLWRFFSVLHLRWHGASVYNGHLRGPVTLTPNAERLAVELSLPVFTT